MPSVVCAHEYEDGFVERALTITIRDGVGYGEYQIGLNSKTASEILKLAEQLRKQALRRQDAGGKPSKAEEKASPTKVLPEPVVEKTIALPKPMVSPKPAGPKQQEDPVGVGEHLTDLLTIKRFGELQDQWFVGRLKLASNGQPIAMSKVSVEPAGRHPFSVMVKFQFVVETEKGADGDVKGNGKKAAGVPSEPKATEKGVVDLQVTDGLFGGHHGAIRYALRSRGSTMLLQSNVAPVLVRAERVEIGLGEVSKAENAKLAPVMRAKLLVGDR